MKKLIHFIVAVIGISIALYSCQGNTNPFGKVVDAYTNGEISEDSIMAYMSDSINANYVYDWAKENDGKNDYATYVLGHCYKFGYGVEQNLDIAKGFYIKAANGGNRNAMSNLAEIYAYGGKEFFDVDSAEYWYNKAAELGDGSAYYHLAQAKAYRNEQAHIPYNPIEVMEILEKGIKLRDPLCIGIAAGMYYYGQGIYQDKQKAAEIISSINREKLDAVGLYIIGQMLQDGEIGLPNYNEAFKCIKKSASQGNLDAKCQLGNFYLLGQGVEQNDSLALVEFKEAANSGNAWAMRCLANCYASGIGVDANMAIAEEWMRSAARAGDNDAISYCISRGLKYN